MKLTALPICAEYGFRNERKRCVFVSPYAKSNYVSHALSDQTSILRFIEDNWDLGRLGDGAFDEKAGALVQMFDFDDGPHTRNLFLDPQTGQPTPHP